MEDNKLDMSSLDDLLASTDLGDVTSEGAGYDALPNGYYLCEVESAELAPNKKGMPMVTFKLKVIQNGIIEAVDDNGDAYLTRAKGTVNRKIFKFYVLSEQKKVKDLISDLLKFEGEVEGESMLEEVLKDENGKYVPLSSELLTGCLDIIVGSTLYVSSTTSPNKNNPSEMSTWNNLLSWKRAGQLGLLDVEPEE